MLAIPVNGLRYDCVVPLLVLSEFEGLYWAEQKSRAQQKRKDNTILVSRDMLFVLCNGLDLYSVYMYMYIII